MGYNEADVVRLARPKGKKCRYLKYFFSFNLFMKIKAISGSFADIALIKK
jgi:hypothetical protein